MTEKRLFRLSLGVVLWIVVTTPYLILYPDRPEGDLTISTDSRGVLPPDFPRKISEESTRVTEEGETPHSAMREKSMEPLETPVVGEILTQDVLEGTEIATSVTAEMKHFHRGIFIENGKRSEILLSFDWQSQRDAIDSKDPFSEKIRSSEERVAGAVLKSRLKGIRKDLPEDLFEISRHWRETDYSGPSNTGDLILLLEGYRY